MQIAAMTWRIQSSGSGTVARSQRQYYGDWNRTKFLTGIASAISCAGTKTVGTHMPSRLSRATPADARQVFHLSVSGMAVREPLGLVAYPTTHDEMDFYLNLNYYDLAAIVYNRYFITRDGLFWELARRVAILVLARPSAHGDNSATLSPRAPRWGLIVRALDGRPGLLADDRVVCARHVPYLVGLRVAYSTCMAARLGLHAAVRCALGPGSSEPNCS